jgi:hypothetical protein
MENRMVKAWRPKEWENPYNLKPGFIGITDPFSPRVLSRNAYERGADAMLNSVEIQKALKYYKLMHSQGKIGQQSIIRSNK